MRKHRIERNLAFPTERFWQQIRSAAIAKARYAKILRLAGQEVATRNQATLEEVLTHSKKQ